MVRLADGLAQEQRILAKPYREVDAKGIQVAEWLAGRKVDLVLLKQSLRGKGPVHVFGGAGVEMQGTEATTLAEALRKAIQV